MHLVYAAVLSALVAAVSATTGELPISTASHQWLLRDTLSAPDTLATTIVIAHTTIIQTVTARGPTGSSMSAVISGPGGAAGPNISGGGALTSTSITSAHSPLTTLRTTHTITSASPAHGKSSHSDPPLQTVPDPLHIGSSELSHLMSSLLTDTNTGTRVNPAATSASGVSSQPPQSTTITLGSAGSSVAVNPIKVVALLLTALAGFFLLALLL